MSSQIVSNLMNATPPTILSGSFLNFTGVFVKVWRCAWHLAVILGLIFVTFSQFEISHFLARLLPKHIDTGNLVMATPLTILAGYFWNFAGVSVKVWWCAWGLAVIPKLFFVTFHSFNVVIFGSTSTKAYRHWVSCESKSHYNLCQIFLKLCRCFSQGLTMCM